MEITCRSACHFRLASRLEARASAGRDPPIAQLSESLAQRPTEDGTRRHGDWVRSSRLRVGRPIRPNARSRRPRSRPADRGRSLSAGASLRLASRQGREARAASDRLAQRVRQTRIPPASRRLLSSARHWDSHPTGALEVRRDRAPPIAHPQRVTGTRIPTGSREREPRERFPRSQSERSEARAIGGTRTLSCVTRDFNQLAHLQ